MMKNIKLILVSFLLIAFAGCEDDDRDTDFIDNAVAPSEVALQFGITQDNTGLVTIRPNAEGATKFEVFFGDGSDQSVELDVGQSVDNVYGEGTYTVRVIATSINGLTTEVEQQLMVSFRAPENLAVTAEVDGSNPFKVNVSATADFAASFLVYFDTTNPDEEPTPLQLGETVSNTYDLVGDYTIRVVALSGGSETSQTEMVVTISTPTVLPIDFEVFDTTVFFGFGGASAEVVANPDTNGNPSATVAKTVKGGPEVFAGNVIVLSSPIDFSQKKLITLDVWSPRPGGSFLLKLENLDDPEIFIEKEVTLVGNSAWEEVTIDFSDIDTTQEYQKIVWFFDFGTVGSGGADWTFYLDNFEQASLVQTQPRIPIGFESPTFDYGVFSFGGANAAIINNPNPSGLNTTEKVFEVEKESGAQTFAGAGINLAGAADFSEGTTILIDVWSPVANVPILYKMEDSNSAPDGNGNPSVVVEVFVNTTVANQWETLEFDLTTFAAFNTNISYDRIIVFPDFGQGGTGTITYFDNIRISEATPPSPKIPLNFESTLFNYGAFSFGGASQAIITNPDMSGINTSGKVFEIVKASNAQFFAGAGVNLAGATDFLNGTTITVDVWSPTAGTQILFKMEDSTSPPDGNGNPSIIVEVFANTTVANQWETLTFDLTTFESFSANNSYDRVILFPDFGNDGDGSNDVTYYFDNIKLTN